MDQSNNWSYQPVKLSRNPIVVRVPAVVRPGLIDRTSLRYFLDLKTPISYGSGTYETLTRLSGFEEPAETTAGVEIFPGAQFEIQDQLDGLLRLVPPVFAQKEITVCADLTTPYVTRSIRKEGEITLDETDQAADWVLKGAIDERHFAEWGDRLFTEKTGLAGKFLTWKPDHCRIRPNQPEYLFFLTNMTPTPTELRLRVKVYFSGGGFDYLSPFSVTGVSAFTVYCIPVGPIALALDKLAKEVEKYEVWVNCNNDCKLSEVRTYYIDTQHRHKERFLVFSGSLGNYDTLALVGAGAETLKVSRQMVDRYSSLELIPTYAETIVNQVTGEREISVSTGWMNQEQAAYLADFLFAREIYLATDREFIPVTLANDSIITQEDANYLISRSFTLRYTNSLSGYSNLPVAPTRVLPPTGWRPFDFGSCVLDAAGKRTGMRKVSLLEKYYLETLEPVIPQILKKNIPGTEGYIAVIPDAECADTPFNSALIERQGTYRNTKCGPGFTGGTALITVPAGKYGSELSQLDADSKAQAEYDRINTQAYADVNGACLTGPEFYQMVVPAGKVNFRFSPNLAGGSSFVVGGNGEQNGVVFTNGWPWGNNTNPGSIIKKAGTNDVQLPWSVFADSWTYRFGIYSDYTVNRTVKVYVEGVQVYSGVNLDFRYHNPEWVNVPDQAKIYIELL